MTLMDTSVVKHNMLKIYFVICYAVMWQHVIGMVCVLFAVLSASRTQHIEPKYNFS